jgi:ribosome-associated protein
MRDSFLQARRAFTMNPEGSNTVNHGSTRGIAHEYLCMNWTTILSELTFRTSRSSGAGGQHVNKTETKVEVLFDVDASAGISEEEKITIKSRLKNRISDDGLLIMSSQKSRSQFSNKEDVIERLQAHLEKALIPRLKRKRTKPSKEAIEERLAKKKQNAEKKESRRKPER